MPAIFGIGGIATGTASMAQILFFYLPSPVHCEFRDECFERSRSSDLDLFRQRVGQWVDDKINGRFGRRRGITEIFRRS